MSTPYFLLSAFGSRISLSSSPQGYRTGTCLPAKNTCTSLRYVSRRFWWPKPTSRTLFPGTNQSMNVNYIEEQPHPYFARCHFCRDRRPFRIWDWWGPFGPTIKKGRRNRQMGRVQFTDLAHDASYFSILLVTWAVAEPLKTVQVQIYYTI